LPSGAIGSTATALVTSPTPGQGGYFTFNQVRSYLGGTGATLPTIDPTGLNRFLLPSAEARGLNLSSLVPGLVYPAVDAYIGFSATAAYSWTDSLGVAAGTYDFQAVAKHEIAEALGRKTSLTSAATPAFAYPADLFRYVSENVSSFAFNTPNGGTTAYASTDGGATALGTYNDQGSGDRMDWLVPAGSTSSDAQNAGMSPGLAYGFSIPDLTLLKAYGWKFVSDVSGLFSVANAPAGASGAANGLAPINAPEPATVSILAVGAVVLGLMRRRRTRFSG
jgi:hypothetical protein